jgi:hypothetical protein
VPGIRSRPDACPECQYIDGFHYLTCSQYQDSEVGRAEQREAYLASREQACRDQIAAGRDVKYWTRKLAEVRSEEQP